MPHPGNKAWLGVAKDSNTVTAAAIAASGTALSIVGTGVPASSTVFFWDGNLSESKAVSAGGGTSSLTVAAVTNAHPQWTYISSQLTASIGPTDWIPIRKFEPMDDIARLPDKGSRGAAVDTYGMIAGAAFSDFSLEGDVFTDTIGYILGALLGAVDFSGGTPNTFAFSQKNTGDTQATPYILYGFDDIETRGYPGSKIEQAVFTLDPAGLFSWTAQGKGFPGGIVATPTPTFSSVVPVPAWTATVSIGGTALQVVQKFECTIARPIEIVPNLDGTQSPYKVWQNNAKVTGKFTIVVEDNTELVNYITATQPALTVTVTSGAGATTNYFQFQFTKVDYGKPKRDQSLGKYFTLEVPFEAIANTTDATTSGTLYSPGKFTIKNSKVTGTFV